MTIRSGFASGHAAAPTRSHASGIFPHASRCLSADNPTDFRTLELLFLKRSRRSGEALGYRGQTSPGVRLGVALEDVDGGALPWLAAH
jgi:hypothetical protein